MCPFSIESCGQPQRLIDTDMWETVAPMHGGASVHIRTKYLIHRRRDKREKKKTSKEKKKDKILSGNHICTFCELLSILKSRNISFSLSLSPADVEFHRLPALTDFVFDLSPLSPCCCIYIYTHSFDDVVVYSPGLLLSM